MINKFLPILIAAFLPALVQAQNANENLLRSNGRIYVVVAVILIILIGLLFYIYRIEKKIDRLRKHDEKFN